MQNTSKSKWQVRLAALGIFALGFLGGALALNLYQTQYARSSDAPWGPPSFRFRNIEERLSLTPEQVVEVEKIFADARQQLAETRRQSEPRFREIRRQTDERLQQVLTPEQWQLFEQIKADQRERRGERRRGRKRLE